ncbi:uncharacterized protein LOC108321515 [Vigna angularis]|uniref:uncharacterized protein LOC108321515 n=1 Tax=Phaseolus angularis TaxID=3914 RepID=UPI00080A11CE|nr:uncharacterized protein LOC108321515 [Vigna angularis]
MAGMIHNNLPVFDSKGYDDWCVKMEAILGFQEVDEIVKKVFKNLRKRPYELLCMGEQKTIMEYIGRIQIMVNVMRACDKVVKDKKIIEKILRTLTPQYDHIVVAIEECKDLETMRVEELQNSLEVHEQRLIERKNAEKGVMQGTNQALQARNNQSFKGRGARRGRGRSRGG